MAITRQQSLQVAQDILAISDQLAIQSMQYFTNDRLSWASVARVLITFNIRDHLKGIVALMNADLDSQAYGVLRSLYENFLNLEYLSRITMRGTKRLTPNQKGFLFQSFPVYMRGLKEIQHQKDKEFRRIKSRRNRLVRSDKYWHGSNLRDIALELDKLRSKNDTPHVDNYLNMFSNLSFISHPNSRDNIYYDFDDKTKSFFLKQPFHYDSIAFFSSLYATRSFRKWAATIKSPLVTVIDGFEKKVVKMSKLL